MEFQDGGHVILFFQMGPISKAILPRWFPTTLLRFKSIGGSVSELHSKNQNVDVQTDVGHLNFIGGLVTCNQNSK